MRFLGGFYFLFVDFILFGCYRFPREGTRDDVAIRGKRYK